MSERAQPTRVFLSSPGDVKAERESARRILQTLAEETAFKSRITLEIIAWDQPGANVPMEATKTPQEAINEGLPLPQDCEIVVVILWARMGTPLPIDKYRKPDGSQYLSGTEWEYENAVASARKRGVPKVIVYRCARSVQVALDDPEMESKRLQQSRVNAFFNAFRNPDGSIKGSVNTYNDLLEFETQFTADMRGLFERISQKTQTSVNEFNSAQGEERRTWVGSPFPGLRPFRTADAPIFFGREDETQALLRKVLDQRVTVVVGGSGAGKSSLVAAGLLPRLRQRDECREWLIPEWHQDTGWQGLYISPRESGDHPIVVLAQQLAPFVKKDATMLAHDLRENPSLFAKLTEAICAAYGIRSQIILFIDQLEELIALADTVLRDAFIRMITRALATEEEGQPRDVRLRLVATLRSDYYAQALTIPTLAGILRDAAFGLSVPGRYALHAMIVGPTVRAGITFDDVLPDQMVADAGDDVGVLPLLAYALDKLYQRAQERAGQRLLLADYQALGGLTGILDAETRDAIQGLIDSAPVLSQLFAALVRFGEQGERQRRGALLTDLPNALEARLAVKRLVEKRLLVTGQTPDHAPTIELAHDALLFHWAALDEWIRQNQAFLVWQREFDRDLMRWQSANEHPDLVLRGQPLVEAEKWLSRTGVSLTADARRYIEASAAVRKDAEQRNRRQRLLIRGLLTGVLLAVFAVLTVLAFPTVRAEIARQQVRSSGEVQFVAELGIAVERYEVTSGRYRDCVEFGGCAPALGFFRIDDSPILVPDAPTVPVIGVDVFQAIYFCDWIDRRLPILREWQDLAFGVDRTRRFPWGNDNPSPDRSVLAFPDYGRTFPVAVGGRTTGGYLGIVDLVGNVSEWVSSETVFLFEDSRSGYPSLLRQGIGQSYYAVGGNFLMPPNVVERDMMLEANPGLRRLEVGFRCVEDW